MVAHRCPKTGHALLDFDPVDPVTTLPSRQDFGFERGGVRDGVGGESLKVEFTDEYPSYFGGECGQVGLAERGAVERSATTEPGAHLDGLWSFLLAHVNHSAAVLYRETHRLQGVADELVQVRGRQPYRVDPGYGGHTQLCGPYPQPG